MYRIQTINEKGTYDVEYRAGDVLPVQVIMDTIKMRYKSISSASVARMLNSLDDKLWISVVEKDQEQMITLTPHFRIRDGLVSDEVHFWTLATVKDGESWVIFSTIEIADDDLDKLTKEDEELKEMYRPEWSKKYASTSELLSYFKDNKGRITTMTSIDREFPLLTDHQRDLIRCHTERISYGDRVLILHFLRMELYRIDHFSDMWKYIGWRREIDASGNRKISMINMKGQLKHD